WADDGQEHVSTDVEASPPAGPVGVEGRHAEGGRIAAGGDHDRPEAHGGELAGRHRVDAGVRPVVVAPDEVTESFPPLPRREARAGPEVRARGEDDREVVVVNRFEDPRGTRRRGAVTAAGFLRPTIVAGVVR